MSSINYFSLGGQDEKWKYSGVLEISNNLFILNAGISCSIDNQYGVKKIIPDVSFLKNNIDRIKGIFIGNPRYLNIGALPYYFEFLNGIPIYTSPLGKEIILSLFESYKNNGGTFNEPNMIAVNPINEINILNVKASAFKVASSIPNSYGWLFKSIDNECIVFIDEFIIANENVPCLENQLNYIIQQTKNKTALLIVGAQSVSTVSNFAYPQAQNFGFLKKCCASTKNRFIVACFEDDWLTLLNLSQIANIYNMNFHIICPKLRKLFNFYLSNSSLGQYTKANDLIKTKDIIVVISGDQNTLYEKLDEVNNGNTEFKFEEEDLFICMTIPFPETEVHEIAILNKISERNLLIIKRLKTIIPYMAGVEDFKMLINSINPFNIVPFNCYYSDYISMTKSLAQTINVERIKYLELCQSLKIDGKISQIKDIAVFEEYVSESGLLNMNKTVFLERQLITQRGIILISIIYVLKEHAINLSKVKTIGLFPEDGEKEKNICEIISKSLKNDLSKFLTNNKLIDLKILKQAIKKSIYQSIDSFLYKKPLILPVITNLF